MHKTRVSLPFLRIISRAIIILTCFNCFSGYAYSQILYFYDEFSGGVTAGGYAPNHDSSGIGIIRLHFPAKAKIRKAILFAGNHHSTTPLSVILNGKSFKFSSSNIITTGFHSEYGSPASVNAIDVLSAIDPNSQAQTLEVPGQNSTSLRYTDFYLLVCYNFPGAAITRVSMFLDTTGFQKEIDYRLDISRHSAGNKDLALGLYTGYVCFDGDAEDIFCNTQQLGTIYGPEMNSGSCSGPYANFYYEDDFLHGLGDDHEDLPMAAGDALSNIRSLVKMSDKFLDLSFIHQGSSSVNDNSIWGVVICDGDTGCPPRNLSISPRIISASAGDSVEFKILSSELLEDVHTIDLDLKVNSDLLGFISASGKNTVTYSNGHLHIAGSPSISISDSNIAGLIFKVYLSRDSVTDLSLSNIQLNAGEPASFPCTLTLDTNRGVFVYRDLCSDRTINKFFRGVSPFEVISINPNPASEEVLLEIHSPVEEEIFLSITNALGEQFANFKLLVIPGDQKHRLDIHTLPSGAYSINMKRINGGANIHFIKCK